MGGDYGEMCGGICSSMPWRLGFGSKDMKMGAP